jgi:hypothetical protein
MRLRLFARAASDGALEVHHAPGVALLHAGQHLHGTRQLTSGHRVNMILWLRSASFRQSAAQAYFRATPQPHGDWPDAAGRGDGFGLPAAPP